MTSLPIRTLGDGDEEVTELEELFRVYLIGFIREVQDHVSEFQLECEYNPLNWGCSLHVYTSPE